MLIGIRASTGFSLEHLQSSQLRDKEWFPVAPGAKLDLALARRGNVPMHTFSRSLVLQRFHNKVGFRETLSMRYGLLKVCSFKVAKSS